MKHIIYIFLGLFFLTAPDHGAAADEIGVHWIWHSDTQSGINMPAGKRFFRKDFHLPQGKEITKAVFNLSADNDFALYVNGKKVGSGDNWMQVSSFDVQKMLAKEENIIAVEAENWDTGGANPAGLIGTLRIDFKKGKPLILKTDSSWKSSSQKSNTWETIEFNDSDWGNARVLGPYGCGPWKAFAGNKHNEPAAKRHIGFSEPETRTITQNIYRRNHGFDSGNGASRELNERVETLDRNSSH